MRSLYVKVNTFWNFVFLSADLILETIQSMTTQFRIGDIEQTFHYQLLKKDPAPWS
jgi:hypothetical protein